MKIKGIFIFAFLSSFSIFSQTFEQSSLQFYLSFGNSPLNLNDSIYILNNGDSVQVSTFKFYITNIKLFNGKTIVWEEPNSYHLVDATNNMSKNIALNFPRNTKFNQVKFNIGIDSAINTNGAFGGDLDPTKGMYWTWQSGYINIKLEGKSNKCNTRDHEFQFHLGGFQYPFITIQNVKLDVKKEKKINIEADLKKFLDAINLSNKNHIMSPSDDAVTFSSKFSNIFSVKRQ